MPTSRMEAFSDGVIAILITVMLLELPVPHGTTWHALHRIYPLLLTYLLSFVFLGIYWNNHHHMLMATEYVNGVVLWANLHLLFWLSLYPMTTSWLDQTHVARDPAILYGINLMGAGVAYYVLQLAIMRLPGGASLREALGSDIKGKISPVLYLLGIGLSFVDPVLGLAPAVIVAAIWLIPDRRLERWIAANRAAQRAP